MSAADARAALHRAADTMPEKDAIILARLVTLLGPEGVDGLRAELRAVADIETPGTRHALIPTPRASWVKSSLLHALDEIARGT